MKNAGALVFAIVLMAILGFLILSNIGHPPRYDSQARNEVHEIEAALDGFHIDHGRYPEGASATVIAALMGDNEDRRIYLEARRTEDGYFLDPWGRPYRIESRKGLPPLIYSLGEDGRRSEDDISNDSD